MRYGAKSCHVGSFGSLTCQELKLQLPHPRHTIVSVYTLFLCGRSALDWFEGSIGQMNEDKINAYKRKKKILTYIAKHTILFTICLFLGIPTDNDISSFTFSFAVAYSQYLYLQGLIIPSLFISHSLCFLGFFVNRFLWILMHYNSILTHPFFWVSLSN